MSSVEFQKIRLHTTTDLVKDQEIIDYEKDAVQRLMMENQIKFAIEIEEANVLSSSLKNTGTAYVLNLIVNKDDLEKVIELLDREGGFGYYIDLDETYDPDNETNEDEKTAIDMPEELQEETEEVVDDDPIKVYGNEDGNVTIEFNKVNYESFIFFILRMFILFSGGLIYLFEIWCLKNAINELEYEMATTIFVMMVIELPILVCFYNLLKNKKKGK